MGSQIGRIGGITLQCQKCRGKCWDPDSQENTQQMAQAYFGTTPNPCVNDNNGKTRCPYASEL